MSPILIGVIAGAVGGIVGTLLIYRNKEQRYNNVLKSITDPGLEYSGLYHYSSSKRFRKATKFFDSYGMLYIIGKTVYYKPKPNDTPLAFDMNVCSVQQEPDWRMVKWFSITTPAGEKFYFNSHKLGFLKNNSDETLKGLAAVKAKKASM